ncbi:hypothetical protein [Aeoliella mucimassa]|uniref:Uncharacterized protein n=1 Tax=Aeoliella mucimassa TaxID=2527972 RepID=A0A518AUX7_9BACT|nr:hypothetical protein [Aeoliella mucimassa]QDU58518.1 hypothetical protein Pan181_47560 [Aeoliella mucimassa]
MNLNAGGIVGGLAGAAIAIAVLFLAFEPDTSRNRGMGKLVVLGVVAGAAAGNFLWDLVRKGFQSKE